jgi:hypothetical protein
MAFQQITSPTSDITEKDIDVSCTLNYDEDKSLLYQVKGMLLHFQGMRDASIHFNCGCES